MTQFESSRISLTNDEIRELIDTLEARKFEERMRVSRLHEQENHEEIYRDDGLLNSFLEDPVEGHETGIGIQQTNTHYNQGGSSSVYRSHDVDRPEGQSRGIPAMRFQPEQKGHGDTSEDYNMMISHGSGEYTNEDDQSSPSTFQRPNSNLLAGDRIISASSNITTERSGVHDDSDISRTETQLNPFFPADDQEQ